MALHHCRKELVTWVPCPSKIGVASGPGTMLNCINSNIFRVKSKTHTARGSFGNGTFHRKFNRFVKGKQLDASETMALRILFHQNSWQACAKKFSQPLELLKQIVKNSNPYGTTHSVLRVFLCGFKDRIHDLVHVSQYISLSYIYPPLWSSILLCISSRAWSNY